MLALHSSISVTLPQGQHAIIARHQPRLDRIGALASNLVSDINILPVVSDVMGAERRPGAIAFVPPVHDFPRVARLWSKTTGTRLPRGGVVAPIAFAGDFLESEIDHFFVDTVVHEVAHVANNLTTPPGGWIDGRLQIHGHRWIAFSAAFAARAGLPSGRDAAAYVLDNRSIRAQADFIAQRFARNGSLGDALNRLADAAFAAAQSICETPGLAAWTRAIDGIVGDWEMERLAMRPMAIA